MAFKDIAGGRFGRLVAIQRSPIKRNGATTWECSCDCGNLATVQIDCLTGGTIRSCGCLGIETRQANGKRQRKRSVGDAAMHQAYGVYKHGAKRRGHIFDITEEEYYKMSSLPCSYCGCEPRELSRRGCGKEFSGWVGSGVFANGLDRVDNKVGYVLSNLVPCCGDCNKSKFKLTVDEFKSLIARQHAFMFNKSKEIYMGLDTQDVSYMEAA